MTTAVDIALFDRLMELVNNGSVLERRGSDVYLYLNGARREKAVYYHWQDKPDAEVWCCPPGDEYCCAEGMVEFLQVLTENVYLIEDKQICPVCGDIPDFSAINAGEQDVMLYDVLCRSCGWHMTICD